MSCSCGCCDGVKTHTPLDRANTSGRRELRYRVGEHTDFLQSMLAALSAADLPALAPLTTRDPGDPSIAMLDAGATLFDLLSFYQERIANEGYLRTAKERRSLIEMARLVGYRPRPGLSASVFLAFTVEQSGRLTIPKGTRAQSVPGQDELPQSFETSAPLEARAEWNLLNVRRTRPQLAPIADPSRERGAVIYLKGVSTALRPGDPLLIKLESRTRPRVYRVMEVVADRVADRTRVEIQLWRSSNVTQSVRAIASSFLLLKPPVGSGQPGKDAVTVLEKLAKLTSDPAIKEKEVVENTTNALLRLIEIAVGLEVNGSVPEEKQQLAQWLGAAIAGLEDSIDDAASFATSSETASTLRTARRFDFANAATVAALAQPPALRNSAALSSDLGRALARNSAATLGMIARFQPGLRESIPAILRNADVAPAAGMQVFALRSRASLFGHNAPRKLKGFSHNIPNYENWKAADIREVEDETVVHLDAKYETITPGSWVVIDTSSIRSTGRGEDEPHPARFPLLVARAAVVNANESRTAYGLSGPSTSVALTDAWLLFGNREEEEGSPPPFLMSFIKAKSTGGSEGAFDIIRRTSVFASSELLELAEAPIETPLCDGSATDPIELADLQEDLSAGRWVIVTGTRTDVPGTSGVNGTELRMIADVRQDVARVDGNPVAGELTHTFLSLSSSLTYCYDRSSVKIWGNVVDATHGETRKETLGNGNGAELFQRFTLKASPLTFTAAPTVEGAASSLEVRVNEVRWRERDMLAGKPPTDHGYVTRTEEDAKTTILFGDGKNGARLPTGRENVKAEYRTGIGRPGNVGADRITLLASKPIGLKDVTNPIRSSGGADADSLEQLRSNIPIALQALDRLVSVRDYADFARSFAGIGKASATRLSDGKSEIIHVTIAGVDDIPILESSDLFTNLSLAFTRLGDIRQPVRLAVRELVMLIIAARVRVAEDYRWDLVEPHIRKALFETFGFDRRELGQPVTSSEVLATIQQVPGVEYVDLDTFGGIPEFIASAGAPPSRRPITPDEIAALVNEQLNPPATVDTGECTWLPPFCPVSARLAGPDENGVIAPAQIAILTPDVPSTLVLTSIS